jgi:hypothetical protein
MSLMLARRAVVRSPLRFSLAATDYLKRLDAGGARIRMFDKANANLIDALVELGGAYWDTAGTITTLCAKGFDGLTVPLRDGMNVGSSNFTSGDDYNVKTGIEGASGRSISLDLKAGDLGTADTSCGCWFTEALAGTRNLIGAGVTGAGTLNIRHTSDSLFFRNFNSSADNILHNDKFGFVGMSRNSETFYTHRFDGVTTQRNRTTQTPVDLNYQLVNIDSRTRIAVSWFTKAMDLATLDGILTTFMSEVDAV